MTGDGVSQLVRVMVPRSPSEVHRQATFLELFFDLVFVVAVAGAASFLHHGIAEDHVVEAVGGYLMVFFAIWWAWMNFTWYASAYDTDDVPYRLLVFVQMIGALVIATGVEASATDQDLRIVGVGYTIIRLAQIPLWLRAAAADPDRRSSCLRYATGLTIVQPLWLILIFFLPQSVTVPGFLVLVVVELLIPVWAEKAQPTPWHPGHMAERYGLFTIIVLGESILAGSIAVQAALTDGFAPLAPTVAGGLLVVVSMWWLYFDRPTEHLLENAVTPITWGYGHYVILASAAAVGAGLAVMVDVATDHAEVSQEVAALAVAVPVATYLLGLWALHELPRPNPVTRAAFPIAAAMTVGAAFLPGAPLVIGGVLAALLAVLLVTNHGEAAGRHI